MKDLIESDKSAAEVITDLTEIKILDREEFQMMDGLVNTRDKKAFLDAVKNFDQELQKEGFDPGDGQEYAMDLLQREFGEIH